MPGPTSLNGSERAWTKAREANRLRELKNDRHA